MAEPAAKGRRTSETAHTNGFPLLHWPAPRLKHISPRKKHECIYSMRYTPSIQDKNTKQIRYIPFFDPETTKLKKCKKRIHRHHRPSKPCSAIMATCLPSTLFLSLSGSALNAVDTKQASCSPWVVQSSSICLPYTMSHTEERIAKGEACKIGQIAVKQTTLWSGEEGVMLTDSWHSTPNEPRRPYLSGRNTRQV